MRMLHVGIGASSAANADLFFQELLGLEKSPPVTLPAELGRSIFAIDRELTVINYTGEGVRFEVFIDPAYRAPAASVLHACLEVADRARFLDHCWEKGMQVKRIAKGDAFVCFVSDLDGNLYEIKEKK